MIAHRAPAATGPVHRRPTALDAASAAPLILEATPSLVDVLGDWPTAVRAAGAAFASGRTELSHHFGLAAVEEGGPIGPLLGLVIAFPARQFGSLKLGTGVVMARAIGVRHSVDLVRWGRVLDRIHPPPPRDSLYVSLLSVAADRRGQGIGTALMERVIAGAHHLGLGISLDVGIENDDARRLYERLGFYASRITRTHPSERELVPIEGNVRMLRRSDRTEAT